MQFIVKFLEFGSFLIALRPVLSVLVFGSGIMQLLSVLEKLGASQIAKNVIFHFDILAFLGIFTDPYFFCKSYIITNLKNNDDITNWLLLLSRIK